MSAPDGCPRCRGEDLDYRHGMTDAVISDYCASLCLDCLRTMIGDHEREAERLAAVSAPLVGNFNATLGVRATDADAFERERTAILAESALRVRDALADLPTPHRRIADLAGAELRRREREG